MALDDYKVTGQEVNRLHVQSAPDVLSNNPQTNKAVFDNLVETFIGKYNNLIDEVDDNYVSEQSVGAGLETNPLRWKYAITKGTMIANFSGSITASGTGYKTTIATVLNLTNDDFMDCLVEINGVEYQCKDSVVTATGYMTTFEVNGETITVTYANSNITFEHTNNPLSTTYWNVQMFRTEAESVPTKSLPPNLTIKGVTANTLPPSSPATAVLSDGIVTLGIPKGDKGDTGTTPDFSVGTVTTGAEGSSAAATITGTDEAPALNLTIPRGNTGKGIQSIYKTGESGTVKTYTILYTDGTTFNYDVTDGADGSLASGVLASTYSSSATYEVGDYVYYSGDLFRCTTAITTAEAWTSGHWTQVAIADEVADLKSDFIQPIIDGGYRVTDNLVDFFFDAKEWVQGRPNSIGAIYAIHNKNKVNVSEGDVIYCAVKDIVYPSGTLYITLYTYDSSNTFVSAVDLKYKNDGENSYTIPSDVAYCYVGVDTKSTSRPLSLATMQAMNAKIYVGESNVKYINIYPKYEIIASKAQSDVDLIKDFSAYDLTGISNLAIGSVHVVFDNDSIHFYDSSVIDYRIGTPKVLQYDEAITLLPDSGYRVYLFVKENGQSSYAAWGWKTTATTIPAKAKWAMTVARTSEDTSVPANLETFKQAVKTSIPTSTLKTRVQNLENAINSEDARLTINARYADRLDALAQMTRIPMLLVFTDIHGFGNYLERIGEFYDANYKTYCNDAICLGDIVYDKFSDDFTFMTDSEFGKRVLLTIGNHDCYNGVTVGGVPQADMYAKFFTDVDLWNVTQPTNASTDSLMYYYKDYSNKIRLIVLDEYYWDSDELTWFANVLDDARTNNLSVIVAQHQGNFGELEYSALDNHAFGTDETSFIRTTDGYQDRRNAVDTFVTNGGDFIGWINGHSHCEQFGTFEVNGHKQFNMTFSNAGQDGTSRVKRPDYSMDCFYYLAVDTTSKYVYVLTIGQAENKWFKRNLMLAYDYANHEVVQYY